MSRKAITVEELKERRQELEIQIHQFLIEAMNRFSQDTNISVKCVHVDFASEMTIGDRSPIYYVRDVNVEIDI